MKDLEARIASLVARVDEAWRRADYVALAFPDIAQAVLSEAALFGDASGADVLFALATRESPAQRNEMGAIGGISLFEGARFSVRVHVSLDEMDIVRNAGHGGALQVLGDPAAFATFLFSATRVFDSKFALGSLTRHGIQIVRVGAAVALQPDTIFAIGHLGRAGLYVRLATSEMLSSTSVGFLPPGVLVDESGHDLSIARRLKCFSAEYESDRASCQALLTAAVRVEDPRTSFYLLLHAATHFSEGIDLAALLEAARPTFGADAQVVVDAINRIPRSGALRRERQGTVNREARLLAAMREWARDGELPEMMGLEHLASGLH